MGRLKQKRSLIAIILISILLVTLTLGLGFFYATNNEFYDATILGSQISNMNYITGTNNVESISAPFIEGLVKTSVNFEDASVEDDDYLRSNAYAYDQLESSDPQKASEIEELYAPLEYQVYDDSFNYQSTFTPTSSTSYSLGVVSRIQTNEEHSTYRFQIRNDAYWSNGDPVLALDFAYGISKQLNLENGTYNSYMLFSNSDIKGMDACKTSQINNEEKDLDSDYSNGFYGLTDTCNNVFYNASSIEEANSLTQDYENDPNGPGIIYYDSELSSEGSFIQFNLNHPNDLFPTMTVSSAYWPVNINWWYENLGYDASVWEFGYDENHFLSDGAYKLNFFDNYYGFQAEKNPYYFYSDLVTVESAQYRIVNEPSTAISSFNNDFASYISGNNSNSKAISDNDKTSSYLKSNFSSPKTTYLNFNLDPNNTSRSSLYYRDPNFRRSIAYSLDRTNYYALAGLKNTAPTSSFIPSRLIYDLNGTDYVDLASKISYQVEGSENLMYLENFTIEERNEILLDMDHQPHDTIDPNVNVILANYYWTQFESDMQQLGVPIPTSSDPVELTFLTKIGDTDPIYKSMQESLQNEDLIFKDEVSLNLDVETPSSYWSTFYDSNDWDIISFTFQPDYLDPWTMFSSFNEASSTRSPNSTSGWTIWQGSDYTFNDQIYDDPELARELFNDGASSFYDGTSNVSFSSIKYNDQDLTSLQLETIDNLLISLLNANEINASNRNDVTNYFTNDNSKLEQGIDYYDNFDYFSIQSNKIISYLFMDLVIKNSAAIIPLSSETNLTSPSKMYFEGNTLTGYKTWILAFDSTRINDSSYWKEVL